MLYEVAIVQLPTPNEVKEGKSEELVLAPTPVIAKDEKGAVAAAVQGRDLLTDMNRAEVYVRPFGNRSS